MSEVKLYAAAHTDLAHIREFFEKNLLRENETPIAFFDGIFYAAKNERVGGLAFHDYLIFSDQSIYLWARGIHKDYLDRFPLGVISASAKHTDEGFAAINLTISRKNRDPITLIFDLVPTDEAEKIVALHFAIASEVEPVVGKEYEHDLPKEVAEKLVEIAHKNLPLKTIVIPDRIAPNAQPSAKKEQAPYVEFYNNTMFYGDDMLSRIKRYREGNDKEFQQPYGRRGHNGYSAEFLQNEPRGRFGPPTPDFEGMFSRLDMVSLKRAEAIAKDILSNIPEKYREQAKKDLAQMPERIKESLNALNELITNLAENPQAQNVVMQTIATAVKNDGLLGAMLKAISLAQQAASRAASPEGFSTEPQSKGGEEPSQADAQPVERKKKIKIRVE
ncbi:MAG: hypothetical protein ACK4XY_00640 [Chloroherpetonaceae bacterium]